MKAKRIAKLIDELNESLSNEPFEAQNLDAVIAFKIFGIKTAATADTVEMAEENGYTGINTRYGRGVYEALCKAYKVDKPYTVLGNRTYPTIWLEKKRDFFMKISENYKSGNGNMDATNLVTFEMYILMNDQEILDDVQSDLDKYCSNGYSSRWTSFGEGLLWDCEAMIKELNTKKI